MDEIQANLDLSEIVLFPQSSYKKEAIHRIQADSFRNFNSMQVSILPQSQNISATNGNVVPTFCMSECVVGDGW